MTATQISQSGATPTDDDAREQMVDEAMMNPRVADALTLFQNVHRLVPVPAANYAPVKYSTSGNSF